MTKRSPDETMHRDLVMWALLRTVASIAVVFIVLMLLADVLWIVCPRLMEPLLR
jgi:Na+-transporting methylmalonyl-CoA/oxaloacetate decarboxylase gamma subunit